MCSLSFRQRRELRPFTYSHQESTMCYDMNAYVELLAGSEAKKRVCKEIKILGEGQQSPDCNQHQKVLLLLG